MHCKIEISGCRIQSMFSIVLEYLRALGGFKKVAVDSLWQLMQTNFLAILRLRWPKPHLKWWKTNNSLVLYRSLYHEYMLFVILLHRHFLSKEILIYSNLHWIELKCMKTLSLKYLIIQIFGWFQKYIWYYKVTINWSSRNNK